jgi:hypothetical protein
VRSSLPLARWRSTTATLSPPSASALASLTHRLDEIADRARERMDPVGPRLT